MADTKTIKILWIVANKRTIKDTDENIYKYDEQLDEVARNLKPSMDVSVTVEEGNIKSFHTQAIKEENKPDTKVDEKKTEAPKEEKPVEEAQKKVLTISRISKDKQWWMFQETGEKVWFGVAENVKSYMEKNGKGDVVEITYEPRNDGKKEINYITFVKSVKKAETPKEENKTSGKKQSYRDEDAVDRRTANMNAKDILVAVINKSNTDWKIEEMEIMLKSLTKICYNIMQNV